MSENTKINEDRGFARLGPDHGEPAFPVTHENGFTNEGMTLRDYVAAKAMQSLVLNAVTGHLSYGNEVSLAMRAYEIADAMIAARNNRSEP